MTPADPDAVLRLIHMAHAREVDPTAYMDDERFEEFSSHAKVVVMAMAPPEADYEWRPERADLLLEDEFIDDARDAELRAGVPLTPEEGARFHELADWEAEHDDGWAGDIYRLAAPAASGETRAAFLTWSGVPSCQYYDANFLGGPFPDIIEAVQYVIATEREPSFWSFEADFPERAALERWLSERKAT